jgi:hypothetical protein
MTLREAALAMLKAASQWDWHDPANDAGKCVDFLNGYMAHLMETCPYKPQELVWMAEYIVQEPSGVPIDGLVCDALAMMPHEKPTGSLELHVLSDFTQVLGRVLEITGSITGYVVHEQVDIDRTFAPLLVRVLPTKRDDLIRWLNVGCILPHWDIEVLTQHNDLPKGFKASWMFGTARHLDGTVKPFNGIILSPGLYARCPRAREHDTFTTAATVTSDCRVDSHGLLLSVMPRPGNQAFSVIRGPLVSNEWVCAICNEVAEVIEVKR